VVALASTGDEDVGAVKVGDFNSDVTEGDCTWEDIFLVLSVSTVGEVGDRLVLLVELSFKLLLDAVGEFCILEEGVGFSELTALLWGFTVFACCIASELIIKWIIGGVDKSNNCWI